MSLTCSTTLQATAVCAQELLSIFLSGHVSDSSPCFYMLQEVRARGTNPQKSPSQEAKVYKSKTPSFEIRTLCHPVVWVLQEILEKFLSSQHE